MTPTHAIALAFFWLGTADLAWLFAAAVFAVFAITVYLALSNDEEGS